MIDNKCRGQRQNILESEYHPAALYRNSGESFTDTGSIANYSIMQVEKSEKDSGDVP